MKRKINDKVTVHMIDTLQAVCDVTIRNQDVLVNGHYLGQVRGVVHDAEWSEHHDTMVHRIDSPEVDGYIQSILVEYAIG